MSDLDFDKDLSTLEERWEQKTQREEIIAAFDTVYSLIDGAPEAVEALKTIESRLLFVEDRLDKV